MSETELHHIEVWYIGGKTGKLPEGEDLNRTVYRQISGSPEYTNAYGLVGHREAVRAFVMAVCCGLCCEAKPDDDLVGMLLWADSAIVILKSEIGGGNEQRIGRRCPQPHLGDGKWRPCIRLKNQNPPPSFC